MRRTRPGHLVRRFFGFLRSRPPTPREQLFVASILAPAEARLFWRQRAEDQRHALEVAARVRERRPDDPAAVRAALLHDVGKAEAPIGAISRSLATVLDAAGLPLPPTWSRYRRHGPIGAGLLREAGSDDLAVAFAAEHPAPVPPPGIVIDRWRALLEADDG